LTATPASAATSVIVGRRAVVEGCFDNESLVVMVKRRADRTANTHLLTIPS
jgi:hypothetical protein